jgi:methylamine dehydrogenase accessory protein MauD
VDLALVGARLLLAAVFAVAGLAKLVDRAGSRQTLADFGVPIVLAGPLGVAVPLVELAVAVALIPTATAWWGALVALALLLVFVVGISLTLASGRTPSCRCFGQIASGPVGRSTLLRNGALAAVASFVVWQGRSNSGPGVVGWLGDLTTAERVSLAIGLVALGLIGATVLLLVQVLRQQGRLLLRLDRLEQGLAASGVLVLSDRHEAAPTSLPVGTPAPTFRLPDIDGRERTLDDLTAAGKPVLLVFTEPYCGPCAALLPDVGRWQRQHADRLTVVVIGRGTVEEHRARTAEHELTPVLLQSAYEVADAYRVYETPSAVLVQPNGTIGSPLASGGERIRSLVAQTLAESGAQTRGGLFPLPMMDGHAHDHAHHQHDRHADHRQPQAVPSPLRIGGPAPALELPDLDGESVTLADLRGSPTLLLFWNPGCGFCQQLLPVLKTWQADPPPLAPKLVVVSTGPPEANRAMGLGAPVLLDQQFAIGSAYGANGTPSAVLLDADGKIASALAVGAPSILALAGAPRL